MTQIQASATFPAIAPEHSSEFRRLAAQLLDSARSEPGTLQYDWFFNADGTRCVVRETYQDSDAVLSHLVAAGAHLARLVEFGGGLHLDVFGEPSIALREALAAFSPAIYAHTQGK